MLTLGIDLASQPKWTSGYLIAWTSHDTSVSCFALGLTDDDIVSLAQRADVVAIDAPFGWRAAALGLTIPASADHRLNGSFNQLEPNLLGWRMLRIPRQHPL